MIVLKDFSVWTKRITKDLLSCPSLLKQIFQGVVVGHGSPSLCVDVGDYQGLCVVDAEADAVKFLPVSCLMALLDSLTVLGAICCQQSRHHVIQKSSDLLSHMISLEQRYCYLAVQHSARESAQWYILAHIYAPRNDRHLDGQCGGLDFVKRINYQIGQLSVIIFN